MFPFDLTLVADVGLHLLELGHHVAVVSLVNEPRQKDRPHAQQLHSQRRRLLDQRRVNALQHVRVGLERQHEKLLELPVSFLRLVLLQLLGHTVERPVQIGGRQIDSPSIHIRLRIAQTVCLRADHATIDDPLVQVCLGDRASHIADLPFFELSEHRDLVPLQRRLEAVKKTDTVRMLVIGR